MAKVFVFFPSIQLMKTLQTSNFKFWIDDEWLTKVEESFDFFYCYRYEALRDDAKSESEIILFLVAHQFGNYERMDKLQSFVLAAMMKFNQKLEL